MHEYTIQNRQCKIMQQENMNRCHRRCQFQNRITIKCNYETIVKIILQSLLQHSKSNVIMQINLSISLYLPFSHCVFIVSILDLIFPLFMQMTFIDIVYSKSFHNVCSLLISRFHFVILFYLWFLLFIVNEFYSEL